MSAQVVTPFNPGRRHDDLPGGGGGVTGLVVTQLPLTKSRAVMLAVSPVLLWSRLLCLDRHLTPTDRGKSLLLVKLYPVDSISAAINELPALLPCRLVFSLGVQ